MNKLVKSVLVFGISLASTLASAASLCRPNSCNPHNGCMDGCYEYETTGVASCNEENPKASAEQAMQQGVAFARSSCYRGFFLTSKWKVTQIENAGACSVQAQATFSCYR